MEFTADQYFAVAVTIAMAIVIMYAGYLVGLKDLKEKSAELTAGFNVELEQKLNQVRGEHESSLKTLKGVFESNRAQLDAAQKQIGLISQENDHLREQAASLAEVVLELESRTFITEQQKVQIRRAARQLAMCAELMGAMFNDENAKTQRLLASQLYGIVQQPAVEQEAAA